MILHRVKFHWSGAGNQYVVGFYKNDKLDRVGYFDTIEEVAEVSERWCKEGKE